LTLIGGLLVLLSVPAGGLRGRGPQPVGNGSRCAGAAGARLVENLDPVQLGQHRVTDYVETVVRLAFGGQEFPMRAPVLLEDRHLESPPEQLAVRLRQARPRRSGEGQHPEFKGWQFDISLQKRLR
jgi:hypothetical protein